MTEKSRDIIAETVDLSPHAWPNANVGSVITASEGGITAKLDVEHLERSASGAVTEIRARLIKVEVGKVAK